MNWPQLLLIAVGDGPWLGKLAFVATYAALLVWLVYLPARLIGESPGLPWWRRSRLWAIALACVQMAVYLVLG